MDVNTRNLKERGFRVSFESLASGRCLKQDVENLLRRYEQESSSRHAARPSSSIPVLVCPLVLRRTSGAHARAKIIEPFWIPASLTPDGELTPPKRPLPWFQRKHLEPLPEQGSVAIGELEAVEHFLSKYKIPYQSDWSEYWTYCSNLFQYVTGESFFSFDVEGYEPNQSAVLVLDSTAPGAASHLARLYDEVLKGRRPAALLPKFCHLDSPDRNYFAESPQSALKTSRKHLGQFEVAFPLSPSQRTALHRFLQLRNDDFLVVTGPPGTGKTTLIQSVVASAWVKAAMQGTSRPPVLLCCAATNQAVTNIIDSFGKARSQEGPLEGRWLPGVDSYGRYCCSSHRKHSAQAVHCEFSDGTGFSSTVQNLTYIAEAERFFAKKFESYSGKRLSVRQAAKFLRRELQREVAVLRRRLYPLGQGNAVEKLLSLFYLRSPLSAENARDALRALDQSSRHKAFQLATHYWEARWLLAATSDASAHAPVTDKQRLATSRTDWQLRAMLTPAFVSTFSMAPRFFAYDRDNREPSVDILVVDEAGQASPEESMICFAMCHKALIVGDAMQLEPVWNVPEHIDRLNLKKFKLLKKATKKNVEEIRKTGIPASSGSLMQRAIASCRWVGQSRIGSTHIGAFLSEHRRCVPPLVGFCNEIAYRGRLQAKRPGLRKRILPAFAWGFVAGRGQRRGTSRENRLEAEAIRNWLKSRESSLKKYYQGRSLEQTVAVITPFAAQKRYLEKLLRPDWPTMTIGTVNALQGAEREVVVFSPTYDESFTGSYFFDRSLNMLNVAVSRAKDSFVVIGDTRIFREGSTPSGILAKYLFAREKHELTDIPRASGRSDLSKPVQLLSSLEDHRNFLRESFGRAQQHLRIVSPQLSLRAIEADKVLPLFQAAAARGVRVQVFTDSKLDMTGNGQLRRSAAAAREFFRVNNIELIICDRLHYKDLAIDTDIFVVGSLNWFSAERDLESEYSRGEHSVVHAGEDAPKMAEVMIRDLKQREERYLRSLNSAGG